MHSARVIPVCSWQARRAYSPSGLSNPLSPLPCERLLLVVGFGGLRVVDRELVVGFVVLVDAAGGGTTGAAAAGAAGASGTSVACGAVLEVLGEHAESATTADMTSPIPRERHLIRISLESVLSAIDLPHVARADLGVTPPARRGRSLQPHQRAGPPDCYIVETIR